jgi:hypothetical protein
LLVFFSREIVLGDKLVQVVRFFQTDRLAAEPKSPKKETPAGDGACGRFA